MSDDSSVEFKYHIKDYILKSDIYVVEFFSYFELSLINIRMNIVLDAQNSFLNWFYIIEQNCSLNCSINCSINREQMTSVVTHLPRL